jgi:flagellar FliL protein
MASADALAPPEPDAAAAAPAARPGKGKLLVVLAIALVVLGGLGGAAWLLRSRFLHRAQPGPAEARPEPERPTRATVPLGAVVVNIAGEGRRYLKVAVDVGVTEARAAKEVEEHKPQILDLLITVLASKDAAALSSAEGRTALKEELLAGIREDLGLEQASRIFFTEFVIQ